MSALVELPAISAPLTILIVRRLGSLSAMASRTPLFEEVCSTDFLGFSFGGRGYQDQLRDSIAKTKVRTSGHLSGLTRQGSCRSEGRAAGGSWQADPRLGGSQLWLPWRLPRLRRGREDHARLRVCPSAQTSYLRAVSVRRGEDARGHLLADADG